MMNPTELIKQRIAELTDWRGKMFKQLSEIIQAADPDLTLEWKWETAVWSKNGLVCALGAFKDSVGINFFQGAHIDDPHKLFNYGLEAKNSRRVQFVEGDKINELALTELVRTAITYNGKPKVKAKKTK